MKMREMYTEILERMTGYEPLLKEQEMAVAECEKAMEKAMAEMDSAEKKLNSLKGKYDALVKMKEAYESAFGLNGEDEVNKKTEEKEEKTEVKESEKYVKKPVKQLNWRHKNARLIAFNRNGEKIGDYATQAAAARALKWDQSSISRFMKFGKDEQIRKKNFYFAWEY